MNVVHKEHWLMVSFPRPQFALSWSGKHTVLGSLIGAAVYEAVKSGLKIWKKRSVEKVALV